MPTLVNYSGTFLGSAFHICVIGLVLFDLDLVLKDCCSCFDLLLSFHVDLYVCGL